MNALLDQAVARFDSKPFRMHEEEEAELWRGKTSGVS
jgi:hypothetical protein